MKYSQSQAWNSFANSGKVEDYLAYCQAKQQMTALSSAGGAVKSHATDNRGNRPSSAQGGRG